MSGKPLSAERRKQLIDKFYNLFRCAGCGKHMEEVMFYDRCRECFEVINEKRTVKAPNRPLSVFTDMARISRGYKELPVPGDLKQCYDVILVNQPVQQTFRNLDTQVVDYLKDLMLIVADPILSYSMADLENLKKELRDFGVQFRKTNSRPEGFKKKLILVDYNMHCTYTREQLDSLAKEHSCPVVDIVDFFNSIKSGHCVAQSIEKVPYFSFQGWEKRSPINW